MTLGLAERLTLQRRAVVSSKCAFYLRMPKVSRYDHRVAGGLETRIPTSAGSALTRARPQMGEDSK